MSLELLSKKNCHERDKNLIFYEETHIYIIKTDPKSKYTSVTTCVHNQFEKFNSDKIIDNMIYSKKWKTNKYYGMTRQQIKNGWNENKNNAAEQGTKLHYNIECFYNKCYNSIETATNIEYKYFKNFYKDFSDLEPYRTEWMIYDEDNKLAGSVDMIFKNPNGSLQIYDWKRCKEISKTNNWNKYSINNKIDYIPDTNYWHYCLQLNTYKYILETKYGKKVSDMYLVVLHPNNTNNNYKRIKVCDLQAEIKAIIHK